MVFLNSLYFHTFTHTPMVFMYSTSHIDIQGSWNVLLFSYFDKFTVF